MRMSLMVGAVLAIGTVACGTSPATGPALPPGAVGVVIAVEISPASGLAIGVGSTGALKAHVVVAPGGPPIDTTVRWSARTSSVAVDATGNVTLNAATGGMVCATSLAASSVQSCVPVTAK